MFRKIAVAYNESAESQRALSTGIRLAKCLGSDLETITVMSDLPSYTAFASVVDPSLSGVLLNDRLRFYEALQEKLRRAAIEQGLTITTHVVDGKEVQAIVHLLFRIKAELVVVGLHRRDTHIARLWSTVYELAQEAPCCVLGVH